MRAGRVVGAIIAVAAVIGVRQVGPRIVAVLATDAGPGPPPPLPAAAGASLAPVARVRVILVDGLGRAAANASPAWNRLCAGGWDLVVDVGFPTLSLPVESALWTGLTPQQVGVVARNEDLPEPPPGSYPARIAGSRAVAEHYPRLIHSFGFGDARPPLSAGDHPAPPWPDLGFPAEARAAVTSEAPLAFVHILRVDEAGHRDGARSRAYREAAGFADALVAELAGSIRPGERWFLLADHGHRARGGHGDAEPEVRLVRACIFGDVPPPPRPLGRLHLVDLSRALAESLGLTPAPGARGRPLTAALADPRPGATIPRPPAGRWLPVGLLLLAALAATGRLAGGRLVLWPLWAPAAYATFALASGLPTMSNPAVRHPLSGAVVAAAIPALILLGLQTRAALRRAAPLRAAAAQLLLPAAASVAAILLAWGAPPVMPFWTGHASLLASLLVLAVATVAAVLLLAPVRATPPP